MKFLAILLQISLVVDLVSAKLVTTRGGHRRKESVMDVDLLSTKIVTSSSSSSITTTTTSTTTKNKSSDLLTHKHIDEENRLLLSRINLQPEVTKVEQGPATRVIGSLSMASGSRWCGGRPTYWLVGHDRDEHPWCLNSNGVWEADRRAEMHNDKRNWREDHKKGVDRHDCKHLDVNNDGIQDIVCLVGANKAKGFGYNELYLTRSNGTLQKITYHGLQKYPAMSTRLSATLKHASGAKLVFVGTNGILREDRRPNSHRMFKTLQSGKHPFFTELKGPWIKHFDVVCSVAADLNADGLDDLILCADKGKPRMYIQTKGGEFWQVTLPKSKYIGQWRNVRVGRVTGHKRPDLVVSGGYGNGPGYLRIFQAKSKPPFFVFQSPYYQRRLPNAAPDLEIIDANSDGIKDIYVTQANERIGYCSVKGKDVQKYIQSRPRNNNFKAKSWKPPMNLSTDRLLVGRRKRGRVSFVHIKMKFHGSGCGGIVEKFGNDQTLIVSRSRIIHKGYNYLVRWPSKKGDDKDKKKDTSEKETEKKKVITKTKNEKKEGGKMKTKIVEAEEAEEVEEDKDDEDDEDEDKDEDDEDKDANPCMDQPDGSFCGYMGDDLCKRPDTCQNGQCTKQFEEIGTICGIAETPCMSGAFCSGDGECIPPEHKLVGTSCGAEETLCMTAAACSEDGSCMSPQPKPVGTSCGAEETLCMTAAACSEDGKCMSPQPKPVGTSCGAEETLCMTAAACSEDGRCISPQPKSIGTLCGDETDTTCNKPDTCDGFGQCISNLLPEGSICGEHETDCMTADKCSSDGECIKGEPKTAGTTCGDPTDTVCNGADTCDGKGKCIENLEKDGTKCGKDESKCRFADRCFIGECITRNKPEGTVCGSSPSSPCDIRDRCDSFGKCIDLIKPATAVCRLASDVCDVKEFCTGSTKGCPPNKFAPAGEICDGKGGKKIISNLQSNKKASPKVPNKRPLVLPGIIKKPGAGGNNNSSNSSQKKKKKVAQKVLPHKNSGTITKQGTGGNNSNSMRKKKRKMMKKKKALANKN